MRTEPVERGANAAPRSPVPGHPGLRARPALGAGPGPTGRPMRGQAPWQPRGAGHPMSTVAGAGPGLAGPDVTRPRSGPPARGEPESRSAMASQTGNDRRIPW